MMLRSVLLFSVALAACSPSPKAEPSAAVQAKTDAPAAAGASCDQALSFPVDFTSPGAKDTVTVRSIAAPALSEAAKTDDTTMNGALCGNATAVFTLHGGKDSALLYSFSTQLNQLELGPGPEPGGWTPENTRLFLQGWAENATLTKTSQAGKVGVPAATVTPAVSAAEFDAVKKADLPMLCVMTSVHGLSCLSAGPDSAGQFVPFYAADQG
jgi:hypothetical protein